MRKNPSFRADFRFVDFLQKPFANFEKYLLIFYGIKCGYGRHTLRGGRQNGKANRNAPERKGRHARCGERGQSGVRGQAVLPQRERRAGECGRDFGFFHRLVSAVISIASFATDANVRTSGSALTVLAFSNGFFPAATSALYWATFSFAAGSDSSFTEPMPASFRLPSTGILIKKNRYLPLTLR